MTGRYRQSQQGNRSRFYILLSVIFLFVMAKWGVPQVMRLIAGTGSQRSDGVTDTIAPQTPALSAVPEATNSSKMILDGFTESDANVELLVNDKVVLSDKAKGDGSFEFIAPLESGQNRIQVRASDSANNISQSEIKIVTFDSKDIEVDILSPKDGSEFFGKNNNLVEIKGKINKPEAQVMINNSFVSSDKDGLFAQKIQLDNGSNEVKVIVSDRAGNVVEKTIKIAYTP